MSNDIYYMMGYKAGEADEYKLREENILSELKKNGYTNSKGDVIDVWIGNLDLYNAGRHVGIYIPLPNDNLWDIINIIDEDGMHDWYIGDVENHTDAKLNWGDYSPDELNDFAEAYENMGESDLILVQAVMDYSGENFFDAVEMIENEDYMGVVYDSQDELLREEFGQYDLEWMIRALHNTLNLDERIEVAEDLLDAETVEMRDDDTETLWWTDIAALYSDAQSLLSAVLSIYPTDKIYEKLVYYTGLTVHEIDGYYVVLET